MRVVIRGLAFLHTSAWTWRRKMQNSDQGNTNGNPNSLKWNNTEREATLMWYCILEPITKSSEDDRKSGVRPVTPWIPVFQLPLYSLPLFSPSPLQFSSPSTQFLTLSSLPSHSTEPAQQDSFNLSPPPHLLGALTFLLCSLFCHLFSYL